MIFFIFALALFLLPIGAVYSYGPCLYRLCVCARVYMCVHVAGQRVRAEVCVYIVYVCVCVCVCVHVCTCGEAARAG